MRTVGNTVPAGALTGGDREQMWQLLQEHYLGVTRQAFERDLAAKEHVILLRSTEGDIVGFSTQTRFHIGSVIVVFSGDTIITEQHRGSFETAREICRYFRRAMVEYPGREIYWVLICKGWRTYRVLRLFFEDYGPRPGAVGNYRDIADAFGAAKYPDCYDSARRLIVLPGEAPRIRPGSSEAIDPRRSDPDMAFFAAANPNHECGHELVCVAPIREDNLTAVARRLSR